MAQIISATYKLDDMDSFFDEAYNDIIKKLVEMGEEAYNTAFVKGRYQNITGNLRSSLGYVIAIDGKVVKEGGFKQVRGRGENSQRVEFTTGTGKEVKFWAKGKAGDGSEGSRKGLEYAKELASQYEAGVTLVVVAGMDYASYVNSRGYDVIDSAEAKVITMLK